MPPDKKVYVNQPLDIVLGCEFDLSSAVAQKVLARSPSGASVLQWAATVQGGDSLRCQVPRDTLAEAGSWRVHAVVDFGDGDIPGRMDELVVDELFT